MVLTSRDRFAFPVTTSFASTTFAPAFWRMTVRHDLQAFSRSIVALIKTSGDTGDSGDKANKSNSYASLPVSTNSEILSPLDPEWRHALPGRGDRISVHL